MKKQFLDYCSNKKFQQNDAQIKTLELLVGFNKTASFKKTLLRLFMKSEPKLGFYLYGDVGVGKTMLLNFFFDHLNIQKKRMHFNQFMIDFHDFRHESKIKGKDSSIEIFVKNLKKKIDLLYLDEFQVTNIVDAMILGKLFENIFKENIKILISSNIRIEELYKDGLQREQFVPFIKIIKKYCIEHFLLINRDYRKSGKTKLDRYFYPLNSQTTFQVNQVFRQLTRKKKGVQT